MLENIKINQNCIVTGGSGAIGTRLVQRLLDLGAPKVTVVDDLSSGYEWLLPRDERVEFIKSDVCDFFDLNISGKDAYLFHLAAFFANQNSVDYPLKDLHTNGKGILTALMWSEKQGIKRFIYSSAGCSIAGHNVDAPIREDMEVSLNLDTPYQVTKALGEFYCNYYLKSLSTVRCRFFNSYGPGEVPGKYRNVIPVFIWKALNDQALMITGTGQETRDFIYVDDLVAGLILCAVKDQANGEAFNLGTGIQTTVQSLAETIIELCDSRSGIVYTDRRDWDHSFRREADNSKARNTLDFKPSICVREGLVKTVNWFKENYDQIKKSIPDMR